MVLGWWELVSSALKASLSLLAASWLPYCGMCTILTVPMTEAENDYSRIGDDGGWLATCACYM